MFAARLCETEILSVDSLSRTLQHTLHHHRNGDGDGGRSSVVSASEFKSEDPGFDLLAGPNIFFLSLRVNSSAYLFVPDTPSCVPYGRHSNVCAR